MDTILLYIGAAVAIILVLRVFTLPVRWIFKLAFNTLLGFLGLLAVNWLGGAIGIAIGINLLNAVVVGILGVPGLILLLLLRWWLYI